MPRGKKAIGATVEEVKKTGRKAKAKVEEAAEKAADTAVAVEVEVKKATRSTTRKAKRTRKAAEAKEALVEAAEAVTKPARKARAAKLDIVIQNVMGGAITPEEIAAKVPKDAVSAYVKVEENKIYWVNKAGETGDVEIWG